MGFLGGLLALLTPCVFLMIPLTVSFFTKSKDRQIRYSQRVDLRCFHRNHLRKYRIADYGYCGA